MSTYIVTFGFLVLVFALVSLPLYRHFKRRQGLCCSGGFEELERDAELCEACPHKERQPDPVPEIQ